MAMPPFTDLDRNRKNFFWGNWAECTKNEQICQNAEK